jgi:hypothetical protein
MVFGMGWNGFLVRFRGPKTVLESRGFLNPEPCFLGRFLGES